MTGKSVKDIDRYQTVLTSLLSQEANKFCADCQAKGPRWASWNLGIFVCIRCAGIHRNLGVHISRVKSVNLDQWTHEQIQCVQEIGNAKSHRLYEAFLPECFQRPDTDQAAEVFIREKYEKKKYMDKSINIQTFRKEKSSDSITKEAPVVFEKMKPKKDDFRRRAIKIKISPMKTRQPVTDLLGLDAPAAAVPKGRPSPAVSHSMDLFGSMATPSSDSTKSTPTSGSMPTGRVASSVPENLSLFLDPAPKPEENGKMSKDSILSLYSTVTPHANNMAAHGGMYMAPTQMGYAAAGYGNYQALPAQGGMMGTMLGHQSIMPQQGMLATSPYMAEMQGGMMGLQNGTMGGVAALPQQMYGMQQAQQLQWNLAQMTHMAGMNFYGANSMMGYGQPMGGAAAPASSHMLGSHVWK